MGQIESVKSHELERDPDWVVLIEKHVVKQLVGNFGELCVSFLSKASEVADGTTVILLRDLRDRPRAVALCSSPLSPELIGQSMERARRAKLSLDRETGSRILDPLLQGQIEGLTFSVLPFCFKLADSRPGWWLQRLALRPRLLQWLWQISRCSVGPDNPCALKLKFAKSLSHLVNCDSLAPTARAHAAHALERLEAGKWSPRYVLMHGDLWKGNILLSPASIVGIGLALTEFVVIDWGGSEAEGFAIFDLVRLARSIGLSSQGLRQEVNRHCEVLQCLPIDARGYLMAALGHLGVELNAFPFERFARMVESCVSTLDDAILLRKH